MISKHLLLQVQTQLQAILLYFCYISTKIKKLSKD